MLSDGLGKASKNPLRYWYETRRQADTTAPGPGLDEDDGDEPGISKALFLGPRGGKWADPQHTIPWDPEVHAARAEAEKPIMAKYRKLDRGYLRKQIEIAREFLAEYEQALPAFTQKIEETIDPGGRVSGRVKEVESAIGKACVRDPEWWGGDVRNLNDGGGLRVVHEQLHQVMTSVARLKQRFKVLAEEDRISNPQKHYRSYHLSLEDPETGKPFEVQVRTYNQDVFADWSHNIYKPMNEAQERHKADPPVQSYEAAIAEYFWHQDTNQPLPPKPDCPEIVRQVFGCLS
jgi:ppGpp synthetase/RelA/SpoT-type nucleotidyltranferase